MGGQKPRTWAIFKRIIRDQDRGRDHAILIYS